MSDTETKAPRSLGEALPAEMARVRDVVIPAYIEIAPSGALALAMMRSELDVAAKALAMGDVAMMMLAYKELKDWNLS